MTMSKIDLHELSLSLTYELEYAPIVRREADLDVFLVFTTNVL